MPSITYPGQFILSLGQKIEAEKITPANPKMKSFAHSHEYLQSIGHPSVTVYFDENRMPIKGKEVQHAGQHSVHASPWVAYPDKNAAHDPAQEDGWIKWRAAEHSICPEHLRDAQVQVRWKSGYETTGNTRGREWIWNTSQDSSTVIAYRVVQP